MKKLLITIDGPAGAGKTTVSKALAGRLCYTYIDTGALYRGVAYEAKAQGVSPGDDDQLKELCRRIHLKFVHGSGGTRLFSRNVDITDHIRTPEMSMMASAVSARPVVRAALLQLQRDLGANKGAVAEGRDMGTVVFPDADVKFFLTADLRARADRRWRELFAVAPRPLKEVEAEMKRRDENDVTRAAAPLKPARDALLIDSTRINAEEVVEIMLSHIRSASGGRKS